MDKLAGLAQKVNSVKLVMQENVDAALANAALHMRATPLPAHAALASILLWAAALVAGRMIAFA